MIAHEIATWSQEKIAPDIIDYLITTDYYSDLKMIIYIIEQVINN